MLKVNTMSWVGGSAFYPVPISMLSELLIGCLSNVSWEGGGLNTAPVTRCDM